MVDDTPDRDARGRFLPGNALWQHRAKNPRFADDAALWAACCGYFDWVHNNPLYEDRLITYKGVSTHVPVPKVRAMTKTQMCRFIGVERSTWRTWKRERPELELAISHAEAVVYDWNFGYAAAGMLDAPFIWRAIEQTRREEAAMWPSQPDA